MRVKNTLRCTILNVSKTFEYVCEQCTNSERYKEVPLYLSMSSNMCKGVLI